MVHRAADAARPPARPGARGALRRSRRAERVGAAADFFGAVHGRPVPYASALQSTQRVVQLLDPDAVPAAPARRAVERAAATGAALLPDRLTLGPVPADAGVLHAPFRRENPTVLRRDFTIADGFRGPGRFVGCNVGVRVFHEPAWFAWYGEGEVKMYLDGESHPTWCGTGLEDYVGTAYGMGAHQTPYQGAPLVRRDPQAGRPNPDLVSFYRWHLPDPIVFERSLRVTIQQIGAVMVPPGDEHLRDEVDAAGVVAGTGWTHVGGSTVEWFAIAERVDDYCATAFVALEQVQGVVPVDVAAAVADVGRADYERPSAFEVGVTG
ncbi:MAG: DUF2961 domain-containing protein [Ilumatobacteraceae bacterium]